MAGGGVKKNRKDDMEDKERVMQKITTTEH